MTVSEIDKETPTAAELAARLEALEARLAQVEEAQPEDQIALIIFSGDLDKVLAGFVIATGAAAMGQQVSMFFTFWGLSVLKKRSKLAGKGVFEKAMAAMTPSSSAGLGVSTMLRKMMKDKGVASLEEMMAMAREMGVKMLACEMSRDVMGISEEELIDGLEPAGVASFLGESLRSRTNLFI